MHEGERACLILEGVPTRYFLTAKKQLAHTVKFSVPSLRRTAFCRRSKTTWESFGDVTLPLATTPKPSAGLLGGTGPIFRGAGPLELFNYFPPLMQFVLYQPGFNCDKVLPVAVKVLQGDVISSYHTDELGDTIPDIPPFS